MKLQLAIFLLLTSIFAQAQNYSELKGKTYPFGTLPKQLNNCILEEAYGHGSEGLTCQLLFDTVKHKSEVLMEKEFISDSFDYYEVLDLVEYYCKDQYQIYVGGIDSYKLTKDPFLVVVEHAYRVDKSTGWQRDPTKIIKAWVFNETTLKLEETDPGNLYTTSESEGYELKK